MMRNRSSAIQNSTTFAQRGLLSSLYEQSNNSGSANGAVDIHMLAVHSISGHGNHGEFTKFLILSLSFFILLFQTYVLQQMGSDLALTKCNSNKECPQGMSCLVEREVNRCMDCSYQKPCYETEDMLSNGTETFKGLGDLVLYCNLEDMKYCQETDKMPLKCDYVLNNVNFADPTSYAILLFVSLLLVSVIIHDMDMARKEERYLSQNAPNGFYKHILISILHGRRIVLPFTVVQAVVCAIVAEPLKPTNLLLNALSVAFILEADDIFGVLFIRPETQERILKLQSSSEELSEESNVQKTTDWIDDRIIGLVCVVLIFVGIQYLEFFGRLHLKTYTPSSEKDEFPCDEQWIAAGQIIFWGSVISVGLHTIRILLREDGKGDILRRSKLQEICSICAGFSVMYIYMMIGYGLFQLFNPNAVDQVHKNTVAFMTILIFATYVLQIISILYLEKRAEYQQKKKLDLPVLQENSDDSAESYEDILEEAFSFEEDWLPNGSRGTLNERIDLATGLKVYV